MFKNLQTNFKLKNLIIIFLTLILLLGFFVGEARADMVNHLVISEFLYDAEGSDVGKEFIELYNPTADDINLLGWSLKYTKDESSEMQSLATFSQEADNKIIYKSGFFLVGLNKYEAVNYNNIAADVLRTASLSNIDENSTVQKIKIILLDKEGNEIDSIGYDKNSIVIAGQSLERKAAQNGSCVSAQNAGENLGNGCDTGNSDDFEIRAIPNPQNSQSAAEPAIENSSNPTPTPDSTSSPQATPSSSLSPEPSSSLVASVAPLQPILPIAEAGADKEAVLGENLDFDGSDSFDSEGKKISFVWDFGDKTNAKGENASHIYKAIGEYIVILKVDNGESIGEDSLKVKITAPEFSDKVILSEILPNPVGVDKDGEWIEIYNSGDKKINLKGWILASGAKTGDKKYIFSDDKFIEAKKYLVIKRSESGLVLTNESGIVSLIWPPDKIMSEVTYGVAKEGKSYVFINNAWQWADAPTPGKENSVKVLAAASSVPKAKENIAPVANIFEKTSGAVSGVLTNEQISSSEDLAIGDSTVNSPLVKSAIFQTDKSMSAEDFLDKLIAEKVDKAILKAKAAEAPPQEKVLALADNTIENRITNIDKEIDCKDFCSEKEGVIVNNQKDIRSNPWFYGDLILSGLCLFLVWRYQEARKKAKNYA